MKAEVEGIQEKSQEPKNAGVLNAGNGFSPRVSRRNSPVAYSP